MTRRCTVCTHPNRSDIERVLVEGGTIRDTARRFGVSRTVLSRHKAHMGEAFRKVVEAKETAHGSSILERLRELNHRARTILEEAHREGDRREALAAIRELRGLLELEAELLGEIGRGTTVAISLVESPEWHQLRDILISTLEAFPEAKKAVVDAIRGVLKN